jgi:hypothetical protein
VPSQEELQTSPAAGIDEGDDFSTRQAEYILDTARR